MYNDVLKARNSYPQFEVNCDVELRFVDFVCSYDAIVGLCECVVYDMLEE